MYPRARTLFSFGTWLRRQRRGIESRAPLREAIELFDVLGASRWSDRARQELRATGETFGPRRPDARDQLTAQELQIAQLAAARSVQSRDRRAIVPVSSHDRLAPLPDLSQARDHLPDAAARRVARRRQLINQSRDSRQAPDVPVTIGLLAHPQRRGSQHERVAEHRARARRVGRRVELERRRGAPPGGAATPSPPRSFLKRRWPTTSPGCGRSSTVRAVRRSSSVTPTAGRS